jgi:hypothetical protein
MLKPIMMPALAVTLAAAIKDMIAKRDVRQYSSIAMNMKGM